VVLLFKAMAAMQVIDRADGNFNRKFYTTFNYKTMTKIANSHENDAGMLKTISNPMQRRSFFKYAGAGAALSSLLLIGCDKDDNDQMADGQDLGSGDVGLLNYAYALEQLEAAFYTQAVATKFAGMTAMETEILTEIRDNEVIHRDFLKAAINAKAPGQIIPDLTPDFSKVDFTKRDSVLMTARTFEDLGVSAYNGAGKLFTDTGLGLDLLLIGGKIVSVEARHAAMIRQLLGPATAFAGDDVVTTDKGLDVIRMPAEVLPLVQPFIKEKINGNNLPK
jgi:hypothetical protein